MIINEDFFDDVIVDVKSDEETQNTTRTMTIVMIKTTKLSVIQFDPKLTIKIIDNIIKTSILFSDYTFNSISFKNLFKDDKEIFSSYNDIPSMSYICDKYTEEDTMFPNIRIEIKYDIIPETDIQQKIFVKNFYSFLNTLHDYVVYYSQDTASISFSKISINGIETSQKLYFNQIYTDKQVSSVYEILYNKYKPIEFEKFISKVDFEKIYNFALKEFIKDDYFKSARDKLTFGETVDIRYEKNKIRNKNNNNGDTVFIYINIENHDTINIGLIYKIIKIIFFDRIPKQFVIKNNIIAVLKFSNEKLVSGLLRITIYIPFDSRSVNKMQYTAKITPISFKTNDEKIKTSTRLCELKYRCLKSSCYIVVPKKNGYLFNKDITHDREKNDLVGDLITKNFYDN